MLGHIWPLLAACLQTHLASRREKRVILLIIIIIISYDMHSLSARIYTSQAAYVPYLGIRPINAKCFKVFEMICLDFTNRTNGWQSESKGFLSLKNERKLPKTWKLQICSPSEISDLSCQRSLATQTNIPVES